MDVILPQYQQYSQSQRVGLKAVEMLKLLGYEARLVTCFFRNIDIIINNTLPCEVKKEQYKNNGQLTLPGLGEI